MTTTETGTLGLTLPSAAMHQVKGITLPKSLELADDPVSNWKLFKRRWNNYVTLCHLDLQSEPYKVALLHTCLGDDAMRVYDGFDFSSDENERTVAEILEKFEQFAVGQTNETYERAIFNRRVQEEGESFDSFLVSLRSLIKSCNFCTHCKDSLLRDRIVVGIHDTQTHTELIKHRSLTLQQCIDVCRSADKAVREGAVLRPSIINTVKPQQKIATRRNTTKCKYCGEAHPFKKELCPAWQHKCTCCRKMNHFESLCQSSSLRRKAALHNFKSKEVHQLNQAKEFLSDEEDDIAWVNEVIGENKHSVAKCALNVNGKRIVFQLDTGASVNLIPRSLVADHRNVVASCRRLKMWNNSELYSSGSYCALVQNPKTGLSMPVQFVVVEESLVPLMGLQSCVALKLITLEYDNMDTVASVSIISEFGDIFADKIGKFPGKVKLRLNPNIIPVVSPPRRTPIALRGKLKKELNRLAEQGVIAPVLRPTDWVNQFVLVPKKDGSIRLCIDPVHLNKALQREHFILPTIDDVLHKLANSDTFTKCDLRWGFLHIELDDESSFLTTFQTIFGRFRWRRLPFGLSVSPEIFQRKMQEILHDLPGVEAVADDVIIHGKGDVEHDRNFRKFLERCQHFGIKLNPKKLEHKASSISFLGHRLTKQGITPDPDKTSAINSFPVPSSITELRRFLGMVNFLGRFIPKLSHMAEPLHNLLKSDVPWNWAKPQDKAFEAIKAQVVQCTTLALFDDTLHVTLECDASDYGVGAALFQEGKPVSFASKALTATERRYAQIEKELLAVVLALEKFHHYVFGRHITVHTDHQPLVAISTKPLYKAPKRLQSLLLRAKHYSFDLQYVPGRNIPVADALSRAVIPLLDDDSVSRPSFSVQSVKFLPVSDNYLPIVQEHTAKDTILQHVLSYILLGWPDTKEHLHPQAAEYFSYRDELAASNGVIMRGDRIVIPLSLRQDIKKKIHAGHQGINACLKRARELVFWPGMSSEIRQFIEACHTCAAFAPTQQSETMIAHDIPPGPWLKLGADMFAIMGNHYLVLVDYFSKFVEVDYLQNTHSTTVIHKLKHHFARHGIPRMLVTDGGPQFTSKEFKNFATTWGFKHTMSSPGNSRSNGQAEAAVKSTKSVLKKCAHSGDDPYLGLLALRNSKQSDLKSSPSQRLFGRSVRTDLPTVPSHLDFSLPDTQKIHAQLLDRQNSMAQSFDSHSNDLPNLKEGSFVRHRNPLEKKPSWVDAQVTKQIGPRTYELRNSQGTILKRNRRFLKPIKQNQLYSEEYGETSTHHVPEEQQTHSCANEKEDSSVEEYPVDHIPVGQPPESPYITRYGRQVKAPQRLNL